MTWLRKDENGKSSRKLSKTIVRVTTDNRQNSKHKSFWQFVISDSLTRRIVGNQFDKIFRKKDSIATNL